MLARNLARNTDIFLLLLNFSDKKFKEFKKANAHVFKKKQITTYMILFIKNEIKNDRCIAEKILFTNFDFLMNDIFISDNSDFFYDAHSEQLN